MNAMNTFETIREINKIRLDIQRRADFCCSNSQRLYNDCNDSLAKKLSRRYEIYNAVDERLLCAVEFLEMLFEKEIR